MIKNNVLIGTKGWLFLYEGRQNQFDYLRGIEKVKDKSVNNFIDNISSRSDYFNELGIVYKHLIFPSKPLLKQEYIPDMYSNISSLFVSYYKDKLGGYESNVLYPLDYLKKVEKKHSTFPKYSTHYSDFAYLEISNILLIELGFEPIPKEFLSVSKKDIRGDLAIMLKISDKNEEEIFNIKSIKNYSIGNRKFLPGNTNDVQIIHNEEAITKKRIIIFGDSFFKGTLDFLTIYFYDILYIRSTFIHKDIIDNYQPDIVLSGTAERYLSNVKSDNKANNFLLALYGDKQFCPNNEYIKALTAYMSYKNYYYLYEEWLDEIKTYNKKLKIRSSFKDADILREVALYFESCDDLETAFKIMKEALKLRPDGPLIKKKFQFYAEIINHNYIYEKGHEIDSKKIIISNGFKDADILREVALYFENCGDFDTSSIIMKKAL